MYKSIRAIRCSKWTHLGFGVLLPFLAIATMAPPGMGMPGKGKPATLADIGLPHYEPPAAYREDLVIHSKDGTFTMKRSVDHGRTRTDMESAGQKFAMIEVGDQRGTTITLMAEQNRAMKQSRARAEEELAKLGTKAPKT